MLHEHRKRRSKFWLILDLEKPEILENGNFKESEPLTITAVSSKYYCSQDAALFIILYRSTGLPSCKASIIFLRFSTFSILLSCTSSTSCFSFNLPTAQRGSCLVLWTLSKPQWGWCYSWPLEQRGRDWTRSSQNQVLQGPPCLPQLLDLGWADCSCCRVNSAVIPLVSGFDPGTQLGTGDRHRLNDTPCYLGINSLMGIKWKNNFKSSEVSGEVQVAMEALNREASLSWKGREGNSGEMMLKLKDV